MRMRPMPIGIDDFKRMIHDKYYYVDKTLLIKELLDSKNSRVLIARPRNFGKSLNLSMIQYFFEAQKDEHRRKENKELFRGLNIMEAGASYLAHMGRYSVIRLSLWMLRQQDFETSIYCLRYEIAREFRRHRNILDWISDSEIRCRFDELMNMRGRDKGLGDSLRFLSACLSQVYHEQTIILIDDYDAPLEYAYYHGFYESISEILKEIFSTAFNENPALKLAVVTGRYTGANAEVLGDIRQWKVASVWSKNYDRYYGFLQEEMKSLISEYGLERYADILVAWYGGYRFGNQEACNPWGVNRFVMEAIAGAVTYPRPFWTGVGANRVVHDLAMRADKTEKDEWKRLLTQGKIEKVIHLGDSSENELMSRNYTWNILTELGYLVANETRNGETVVLEWKIPNEDVGCYLEDQRNLVYVDYTACLY